MPLYKIINDGENQLLIWKIEESIEELQRNNPLKVYSQNRLYQMKSVSHQKGFLAVRKILNHLHLNDYDLFYDEKGKPQLTTSQHISISHSFDFAVILLSNKNCGVDIEIQKEKILKIGPRFCNEPHLNENYFNEVERIKKYTIAWGIKESIFKIKNIEGISFPEHIFVNPFQLEDIRVNATLNFNNLTEHYEAKHIDIDGYSLVWIVL